MIRLIAVLALVLGGLAADAKPAKSQCTGNFPANTVCGNANPITGQAKPTPATSFSTGGGGGGGTAGITRTQITSTNLTNFTTITVNGYAVANDLGYGATYTQTGATCPNGLNAVKDSVGNCFNQLVTTTINPGWFGAKADDGATTISSGDISAHTEWRGTYTAGQTWDYVGTQEAVYAAFAKASTPGVITWNSLGGISNLNLVLSIPNGTYGINATINAVVAGFTIRASGRGAALYDWTGASPGSTWLFNSGAYGLFENFSVQCVTQVNFGSAVPCVALEHTGGSPGGLLTQQLTFINYFENVGVNGQGLAVNRLSGGVQGDTITFINAYAAGDGATSDWAYQFNGGNTLEITFVGGDCQAFMHDCIQVPGGQVRVYGAGFQNENFNGRGTMPPLNQIVTGGADVDITAGNTGSIPSAINNIRSEAEVLAQAFNGGTVDVFSAVSTGSDGGNTYPTAGSIPTGYMVQQGTKSRWFVAVDDGGQCQQWCQITTVNSATTITDSSASYTPGALVGLSLYTRFASNGFTVHCDITANTATTITGATCNITSQNMYSVVGVAGGSPPSWDTAPLGNSRPNNLTLTTHATSNCVNTNLGISTNQYIIIPYADKVTPASGAVWPNTLYAKVTGTSGSPCPWGGSGASITLNKNANVSISSTPNIIYWGTGFSDNNITWLQIPYDAINTAGGGVVMNYSGTGQIATSGSVIGGSWPVGNLWYDATNPNNQGPNSGHVQAIPAFLAGATSTWMCTPSVGATYDITNCMNASSVIAFATQTMTINSPNMPSTTQTLSFILASSGNNEVVTFGTNFNSNGPVQMGSSPGKVIVVNFVNTTSVVSNKWQEVSRTQSNAAGTNSTVASPAGPNSTSVYTMQGLAGTITPARTGNIVITICSTITETGLTAAGNGILMQLSYGTSTAPTSNAALTGTQVGTIAEYLLPATVTAADVQVPVCQTAQVTGLTIGIAYWIDIAAKAVSNTGFALSAVNIATHEF